MPLYSKLPESVQEVDVIVAGNLLSSSHSAQRVADGLSQVVVSLDAW